MNNEGSVWVVAISLAHAIRQSDFKTSSSHALFKEIMYKNIQQIQS